MAKTVAIHQPNFFPWLGFFDKMIRSDAFVLLDHVQFPKTGGFWGNRVKLLINGEARWVTAPILRNYHGVRAILEMEFHPQPGWREKIVRTIAGSYGKRPRFTEAMAFFEPLILNADDNIARYNSTAIITMAERLGIPTDKVHWSSRLSPHGHSNEMLVALTKSLGGDTYLCGGGADDYQDAEAFGREGVVLRRQEFQHPRYSQGGGQAFIPGLSIVDAVMNVGWDEVRRLLDPERRDVPV